MFAHADRPLMVAKIVAHDSRPGFET